MTALTPELSRAVEFARDAHDGQTRKGTEVPYLAHLLAVASLVLEHGGTEDQAIAGLLHDVVEDCGDEYEEIVRREFGDAVATIVMACTDGTAEGKREAADGDRVADWRKRKLRYLEHLREEASPDALLVSACDKLHNAMSILTDLEDPAVGAAVFARFKPGRDATLAYYESVVRVFTERGVPVARRLDATVARMHELVGKPEREPLT